MTIATPYYLIDEKKLLGNLRIIKRVRESCGAKSLLALKCFSTWCVFDLMKEYMDGTTSSSLFEARLGNEKFGGETHAYCVAWSAEELRAVKKYADTVIFNSVSQLERFQKDVGKLPVGLRINPGFSHSHYDLADPSRKHSRLGVISRAAIEKVLPQLSGCMFHYNCENSDFANFASGLDRIGKNYGSILRKLEWISLGGGIAFTSDAYPLDDFCRALKSFSDRFGVQIYLEPGEAAITGAAELVTTVLDVVRNRIDIAIIDASMEAHTLDHLIYRTSPRINSPASGPYRFMVAGRSCLAGDVFGTYSFASKLKPGSTVRIADAAGYTMVKKNWFNGLAMPSIAVRRRSGKVEAIKHFDYHHFLTNLS